ncbi:MAG: hypothetical protein ABF636_01545 [Acetobacter sp.]
MVDYTKAAGYVTDSSGRPQFQDRDEANGIPGTSIVDYDLNQERNSLVDLVKAAGITPDGDDDTQVTQAVQYFGKKAASGSVMGTPGVLADGDVAGSLLYYAAAQKSPVFVYGTATVALVTTPSLSSALVLALAGYLRTTGGNVTGTMDWGDKATAGTTTHRFWSAGAPAEGDTTPDATLTVSGGTPGTANKGGVALSAKELDLSETEQVLVPDAKDFTSQQAVSAKVADGRYPASVPETGQARIASLVQDANGRTVSNETALANLTDIPGIFVSAPQIIQRSYIYSIPHNLGRTPTAFGLQLQCVTADLGYVAGEIMADPVVTDGYYIFAIPVSLLGDNITLIMGGAAISMCSKSNMGDMVITNINIDSWRIIFWAM